MRERVGTDIGIKLEEEEKHGQNGEKFFGYNIHIWCSFTEIFGILFSFHISSATKLLKVESESKN